MSDQSKSAGSPDPRVDAALRDYLERIDRGEPVDREAFLAQHAEVAESLKSFIAAEEELRGLAGAGSPRGNAGISTRSFAAHGQETVPPKAQLNRPPETTGSGLTGRFGRYQIVRALGKGAMGTVYLAEDTQLERKVAIKTPHFEDDPTGELLARFYREARAAATLRHANICPVHDVGQIDGKHYISMAYIEGQPLSTLIRPDKPLSERQALLAIHKLAKALQEAHDHGIVHRDLKPANIMVDKKGEPVIMDFGLARKARREGEASLTHSGMILGSPAYMSPEQVEGDPESVGPASDQYSLGVILYELLTAQLPFRGTVVNVLAQIITKEPTRPSGLRADLDPRIEAVCLKMMAKQAADRFPSMKAVADEVATLLKSRGPKPASISASSAPFRVTPERPKQAPPNPAASQILKSARQKTLTESDLASLGELAGKCLKRRDYDQVIQIVERIPEERRSAAIEAILATAREKADEIAFLVCEIDEADRLEDAQTALKKASQLLQLKPGHHRAQEIETKYSGEGAGGPVRIGPSWQLTERWDKGGWIPWTALAFGVAVVGVMLGVMVIYLGRTAIVVDVQDPGIEVEVNDQRVTINVAGEQSIRVEPGDQTLKVSYAGLETVTKSFTLDKGKTKRLTVRVLDNKLVADLQGEILPLIADTEKGKNVGTAPAEPKPASPRSVEKSAMVRTKPVPVVGVKKPLAFQTPGFDQWVKQVAAQPAEEQLKEVAKKLQELNPGFDGKLTGHGGKGIPLIENGVVTQLGFDNDNGTRNVTDISPLRALGGLKWLWCGLATGRLADLSPLTGMQLENLVCPYTRISDLSPLTGMKLEVLDCAATPVSDLSPLKGMPLSLLCVADTPVSDISILQGMMSLKRLTINNTQVTDLRPLQGMRLDLLYCDGISVSDWSLLKDMPLKHLSCDFKPERDTELLRSFKHLETINRKPAAEFWREVEGSADPDRRAAEWVLSIADRRPGIEIDGEERDVDRLPPRPFKLRKVDLYGNQKVTDAGLACFKRCKNLKSLELWATKYGDAGLANFKDCKELRELYLEGDEVTDSGLAIFKDCNLTAFGLASTNVTDRGLAYFKNCKNLESLSLRFMAQVSDAGLAQFQDCTKLKFVDLYATKITDSGLAHLSRCVNLEELNVAFGSQKVSDASMRHIGTMRRLKKLWLGGNPVTNAGLVYLEGLTQLESLDLGGTRVHGPGLEHLRSLVALKDLQLGGLGLMDSDLVRLRSLTALERLGLDGTRVSGPGLANLKGMNQLRDIDLSNSRMTDPGLEQLKDFPQLQKLHLRGTLVANAGLRHLEGMTNLDELDLSDTKVTAPGVAALQKSLPACRIITKADNR
ncbi:MAG TPA: protein kinase [Planctomycetaceae bacterium]|nr:protein kinase [Planctomycetaceae bacterium]